MLCRLHQFITGQVAGFGELEKDTHLRDGPGHEMRCQPDMDSGNGDLRLVARQPLPERLQLRIQRAGHRGIPRGAER